MVTSLTPSINIKSRTVATRSLNLLRTQLKTLENFILPSPSHPLEIQSHASEIKIHPCDLSILHIYNTYIHI